MSITDPCLMVTIVLDLETDLIPMSEIRDWLVVRHRPEIYPYGGIELPFGVSGLLEDPFVIYGDHWSITPYSSKALDSSGLPITLTINLNYLDVASRFFFSYESSILSMSLTDERGYSRVIYG